MASRCFEKGWKVVMSMTGSRGTLRPLFEHGQSINCTRVQAACSKLASVHAAAMALVGARNPGAHEQKLILLGFMTGHCLKS